MNPKKSEGIITVNPMAAELAGSNWLVASRGCYWTRVEFEEDPWEPKEREQDSFLLPEEDRW